eukprot:TRINITY_DN7502_c0_g1_i2.p1 TRINITY_DN7502_c0_g1~~TRINITY_DN7502_c0_g1_i2.p1  ORF type:complete len:114 (+),score=6.68 TRINITY_DN7502_c0_g1_i2:544-885(+)
MEIFKREMCNSNPTFQIFITDLMMIVFDRMEEYRTEILQITQGSEFPVQFSTILCISISENENAVTLRSALHYIRVLFDSDFFGLFPPFQFCHLIDGLIKRIQSFVEGMIRMF